MAAFYDIGLELIIHPYHATSNLRPLPEREFGGAASEGRSYKLSSTLATLRLKRCEVCVLRIINVIFILAAAASCSAMPPFTGSNATATTGYRIHELLLEDRFDGAGDWRGYSRGDELFLGVQDGAFLIDFSGRQYVWTQGERQLDDVVIEAEATQFSDYDHNAFGLACRLDPGNRGRGYYFLISGDGHASIRWGDGRSLAAVVQAAPASPVKTGKARNRLRAVCIEDYLALWVNGELVAEARDQRASRGAVGLAGVMNYDGPRLSVAFDNLRLWRAALDERER